jgi:hypothetical protein
MKMLVAIALLAATLVSAVAASTSVTPGAHSSTYCTVYDPWGGAWSGMGKLTTSKGVTTGVCYGQFSFYGYPFGYATLMGPVQLRLDDTSGLGYGCGTFATSHWSEAITFDGDNGQATLKCTAP